MTDILDQQVTDEDIAALQTMLFERGIYAGVPMPIAGSPFVLEDRHPHKTELEVLSREDPDAEPRSCSDADVDESCALVNRWYSYRHQGFVHLVKSHGKLESFIEPTGPGRRLNLILETLGAARAWDIKAEGRALERLSKMTNDWQFRAYLLTGSFLETSKRSHVTYLFRKVRPTLALRPEPKTKMMHVIASLCLHPVGWRDGSFAGAMVPSDDVIAHLVLMRGREEKFWARANQHSVWEAESGV